MFFNINVTEVPSWNFRWRLCNYVQSRGADLPFCGWVWTISNTCICLHMSHMSYIPYKFCRDCSSRSWGIVVTRSVRTNERTRWQRHNKKLKVIWLFTDAFRCQKPVGDSLRVSGTIVISQNGSIVHSVLIIVVGRDTAVWSQSWVLLPGARPVRGDRFWRIMPRLRSPKWVELTSVNRSQLKPFRRSQSGHNSPTFQTGGKLHIQ